MPQVTQEKYKGWDVVAIESKNLKLLMLPQVGGRVISMQWKGTDLSFQQPERLGLIEDLATCKDLKSKKQNMGFPLWGGDKTWLAPQFRWNEGVPFIDLDSGQYLFKVEETKPTEVVMRMVSPVCRETGIQVTRNIWFNDDYESWIVEHELLNTNKHSVQWGIWDVNMVLKPGKVYFPVSSTSKFEDGVKTYEEEGESIVVRDSVLSVGDEYAVVDCSGDKAFKYGSDAYDGWLLGVLETSNGLIGYKKHFASGIDSIYAHESVIEVYNSDKYNYFEMEVHAPLVPIAAGEKIKFTEKQKLFNISKYPESIEEIKQYLID